MSDHIYSLFFTQSKSSPQLLCQYVECNQPLTSTKKFCNLTCCNKQNALRQTQAAETRRAIKRAAYEANPKICANCKHPIPYATTLNGPVKFCSRSCSASFTNKLRCPEKRKEQGRRLSEKIQSGLTSHDYKIKPKYCKVTWKICPFTGKPYHTRKVSRGNRQNSPYAKSIKAIYYQLAKFKFNVYHMPDLFDLDLLARLGWYTCPGKKRKNHTKNTDGVSRDHMYSIAQGIENKVHPMLLGHPANCRLIEHKQNKIKHAACEIELDELITRIKQFDNANNRCKDHNTILNIIMNDEIYVKDWESLRKYV
jgi:hypothetical protein